jgi:hypothetical protein
MQVNIEGNSSLHITHQNEQMNEQERMNGKGNTAPAGINNRKRSTTNKCTSEADNENGRTMNAYHRRRGTQRTEMCTGTEIARQ